MRDDGRAAVEAVPEPVPAPVPTPEPVPALVPEPGPTPVPVPAPIPTSVPEELVERLAAELRDDGPGVPSPPWGHPAVGAVLGGVAVLAVLLVAMTVAGLLV